MESTLLIVDENSKQLAAMSRLAGEHLPELQVITCGSAAECLKIARSRSLDGIIIESKLKKMDGLETCRHLKDDLTTRRIPVLMIVKEGSDSNTMMSALEAGAEDVISRPIEDRMLGVRLRIMLRVKHAEDERNAVNTRLKEMVAERTSALLLREERYRKVVELSPDMIAICENRKTLYINEAGRKMLGIDTMEASEGLDVTRFAGSEFRPTIERMIDECMESGSKSPFQDIVLKAIDGSEITVEASVIPLDSRESEQIQFFARDVTDRKKIENQSKQSQRLEAVGRLSGGVAHDFNNVLTTIRGFSELLLDSLNPEDPLCEDVLEIKRATERAAALTRQLLAFSRRQVLEPKPLDMNNVVLDIQRMLERMIGEDIDLVTKLERRLGTIRADRSQIEQVIMNLAVNARDAMPNGGTFTITTKNVEIDEDNDRDLEPDSYILFEATDTGIGMEPEVSFHIFEPFFTTKEKDKGTGLGLSTVYGIVKQSGGDIEVISEPGLGTTFRIYLPIIFGSDGSIDPVRFERGVVRGWETVLLVEDETSVRVLVKRMLERAGYSVLQASCGKDALKIGEYHEGNIHLILTDVVMPEINGYELADQLQVMHPTMRILFMSGYSDESILKLNQRIEKISFLQKPFSYQELTDKVRKVLDDMRQA